jgi:dihydroxy-acid dehydratase
MSNLRSNFEPGSTRWAVRRAQWIAMGIPESDFEKPKIAVVNSSSSLSVCYQHLDRLSGIAQEAIRAAGGLPFEIRTVAPSDFVTSAGLKARYLMPTRDLLVNDVEVMVEGSCLDGMLFLSSCDKTTPAHLMAAARLNLPSLCVPCGYQLGGSCGGKEVDIEEVYKAVGSVAVGAMPLTELTQWTRCAIQGPGVCAGLATANSMHCLAEALGMALPGTTPIRAGSPRLDAVVAEAARRCVELVLEDLRPRDILTEKAFGNAVAVAVSIGASVNTVRHLAAISVEAGLSIDMTALYEEKGRHLPLIAQVRPNGPDRIEAFDAAGGTRAAMASLGARLDGTARSVSGRSVGGILSGPVPVDRAVIRTAEAPFRREPGLVVIRGNLAPSGAIVKLSAFPGALRLFEGPARIFEDEDEAIRQLQTGGIRPGDVVVLRMMGPLGGPGTVFACSFMAALVGAGLSDRVAVVTDGELSGLNRGITIGQVMPEAARGGPLAVVAEGESVRIDLDARRIDIMTDAAALAARGAAWRPRERSLAPGWLAQYAQLVQPIETGAVLGRRTPSHE